MDGQYRRDGEPEDASVLHHGAAVENDETSNLEISGRTALAGKWGSTFWKNCQPMRPSTGSVSGQESKSDSEYQNEEGSDEGLSYGREDELGDDNIGKKGQRSKIDVPSDESDDYYDVHDGDNRSASLHQKTVSHRHASQSKFSPRSSAAKSRALRNSTRNEDKYDDNYDDDDNDDDVYEDDDEEDGKHS